MNDRGFVLPMSEELMARMRRASERTDRDQVVVLWDGTMYRPWGTYLTTETEREYAHRQTPLREARHLTADEIRELLASVKVESVKDVAMLFHVHPDTVDFIVNAVAAGVMRIA